MDTQTAGAREGMMEMKKKNRLKKGGDGETPLGWIPFGTKSSTVFAFRKLVRLKSSKTIVQ